jgi:hypothetical protein
MIIVKNKTLLRFFVIVCGWCWLGCLGCERVERYGFFVEDVDEFPGPPSKSGVMNLSAYHANRLLEEDFRLEKKYGFATGHPGVYHLNRLIELGELATPELLCLLEINKATPFDYSGTLYFEYGLRPLGPYYDGKNHIATIADLADYALREIYKADPGFRSFRPEKDRMAAITAWRQIAYENGAIYRKYRLHELSSLKMQKSTNEKTIQSR